MKSISTIIIAWLLAVLPLAAQESGPKNLLHVKAGGNYSNMYGGSGWARNKPGRFGFIGGVEYERVMGRWGISAGAMFSMQGKKDLYLKGYARCNLFVLPVTLNYHINGGPFSVRGGIQYGRGNHVTDWAVPIGVSFRLNRFSADLSYKIGLYTTEPLLDSSENQEINTKSDHSSLRSGVLSLMVGYNFFAW